MGFLDKIKDGIQSEIGTGFEETRSILKKGWGKGNKLIKKTEEVVEDAIKSQFTNNSDDNNDQIAEELRGIREAIEARNNTPEIQSDSPVTESTKDGNVDHREDANKHIVSSIELSPQLKQGKKDHNKVIISYSNSQITTYTVTSELFYFLYLLCLDRLSDDQQRWVPLKSAIDMKYINIMEDFIHGRLPRYFSWIENKSQKQTVVSKINKGIAPIISRIDEETADHGQESYYSLIGSLSTQQKITLNRLE